MSQLPEELADVPSLPPSDWEFFNQRTKNSLDALVDMVYKKKNLESVIQRNRERIAFIQNKIYQDEKKKETLENSIKKRKESVTKEIESDIEHHKDYLKRTK